jgi:CubicO group peptidase (beta-lactamase class C family)
MKSTTLVILAATACTSNPSSMTDAQLQQVLERHLLGDRTGACVAAAVIDQEVHRTVVCANPAERRALDGPRAFEIGSVSKTMTASLLADLIDQGKLQLSDPVARYLPPGTAVPTFAGAPILLEHLVTHTSGLPRMPSRFPASDPSNPYRDFTNAALFASLGDVTLTGAPGSRVVYSNFGAMLLSYVVSHVAGKDFEALAHDRLFAPLAMRRAFVNQVPAGTEVLEGHQSNGDVTSPWDFSADLAGVGGVRATLDDMILYAEAQLGRGDAHTVAVLAKTHEVVDLGVPRNPQDPDMAMGWIRVPLGDRTTLVHDGGTGGFSSFVAIDPERDRAIVVLADTALSNLGGVDDLGFHLLDDRLPLSSPRTVATPSSELVQALVGRYRIDDLGLEIELSSSAGVLRASLSDGSTHELGFDSHGDFYPRDLDALLTPTRATDGSQTFVLTTERTSLLATRLGR